jgi:phosphoribosylformimino-5-aminoimidazole carboxamide ribotide isomerase
MRVIGVLDLKAGRAVHAVAGRRDEYRAVRSALGPEGDAVEIATAYRARLGLDALYVADLDAIAVGAPQGGLVRDVIAAFRQAAPGGEAANVWLDAGISTVVAARDAIEDGASRAVIGLETLGALTELTSLVEELGASRLTFGLDLRDGEPVARNASDCQARPTELVTRARAMGVRSFLVLDLARVGTGRGVDLALLRDVRAAAPDAELLAGGGVRGREELERLALAGVHGALVATALLDGTLSAADVEAARRRTHGA